VRYSLHNRAPTMPNIPAIPDAPSWPEDEVTEVDTPVDVLDRPSLEPRTQTQPYVHQPSTVVLRLP